MRQAGVPSRIVIGYQGGEMNPVGQYLMVRRSDAHAWAEVWLPERGWTRVDPTTAVAPERIELGLNALLSLINQGRAIGSLSQEQIRLAMQPSWLRKQWRGLRMRWDAINNAWDQWVKAYDSGTQQTLMELLGMRTPDWIKMAATAVIAIGLLLLLFAAFLFYPKRRHDPVQLAYRRFCKKLTRLGLARAPHEGPLDFARRVIRARPDLKEQVQAVTGIYVRLRYDAADPAGLRALQKRVRLLNPRIKPVTS